MFSIHEGSTGPSKTIHFHSSVSEVAISRKVLPTTPSVHSWVRGSKRLQGVSFRPYSFIFIYQSKFSNHGCPFKILHCVWVPTKKDSKCCMLIVTNFVDSWLRDHSLKTSACLRGGGVKNLPNLPTDSTKKLPTIGVKNLWKIADVINGWSLI